MRREEEARRQGREEMNEEGDRKGFLKDHGILIPVAGI